MKFYKSGEAKFVDATCPECGASLEIDSQKEMATCPYCGKKWLIEKPEKSTIDKVFNFVERQQQIYFERKEEKRKQKEERRRRKIEERKKVGIGLLVISAIVLVLVGIYLIVKFA